MVKIKFVRELDHMIYKDQLRDKQLLWRVINDFELEILDRDRELIDQTLSQMFYYIDLKPLIIERLINQYYYDDFDEINSILTFAAQMLLTDEYEKVSILSDLRLTIKQYFTLKAGESYFDYDHQKQLFFKQVGWLIDEVTARAIDEKKQDEQHQVFIQSLRDYVKKQEIGSLCLVKWEPNRIGIYRGNGEKFTKEEIDECLLKTPIHIYQFTKNEYQISPFLALNPKEIHVYSEDTSDPALITLQSIFDERLKIIDNKAFPY